MDLSLLPSWEEPFGLVTVESMAMGTPPLVSAVGGGPELVQDGVTGRLLDPHRPEAWAAAARTLLEDDAARARMGGRRPRPRRRGSARTPTRVPSWPSMSGFCERGAPRWLS